MEVRPWRATLSSVSCLIQLCNTHFSMGSMLKLSQEGFVRRGNLFFGASNNNGWEEYMFLDAQAVL